MEKDVPPGKKDEDMENKAHHLGTWEEEKYIHILLVKKQHS